MFRKKQLLLWLLLFGFLASVSWFITGGRATNSNIYYKIDKGLFYLKEVFEGVSKNYVDDLDPEVLSKSAIQGMVKELDPYTVFFEDPGSQRLGIITHGKYGGLGMEIGMQDGKITVISPMDDTPAQRAGIRAGDVIVKIDDEPTATMSLDEASRKLRGQVGTQVTIEIERPGLEKSIQLTLTREEIVIKDVSFAEFIEPGTAFFRLSGFSDKAGQELKEAIRALQKQQPIERVILDLRGNPGGLLTSAVEVANIFLPQGELVVYTKGAHENESKFFTQESPLLPTQPMAVLVNQGSASASEIVAGALQDLDRAVLVGSTTFGKGLVQKVFPVDKINQAYLKLTTAKYYIPSGRSIQKEDYKKNQKLFVDLSDSVEYNKKTDYYTKRGRVVHGGGGIKPDVEIPEEEIDFYLRNIWSRGYLFQFTVDYLSQHPELKNAKSVEVTPEILAAFRAYLSKKDFDYTIEGEEELEKFLKVAAEKKYNEDIQDLVEVALQKLNVEKQSKFDQWKTKIQESLEAEFAEKIGGNTARLRSMLAHDKAVAKALAILKHVDEYQQILAIRKN